MAKPVNEVAKYIIQRIRKQMESDSITTNKIEVDIFLDGKQIKKLGERYHLRNAHVDELVELIKKGDFDVVKEGNGIRITNEEDKDDDITLINSI